MRRGRSPVCLLLVLFLVASPVPAGESFVGLRWPSEKRTFVDAVTQVMVTALTTSPAVDGKIYHTHPSWSADGRYIAFNSRRSGGPELHVLEETTGEIIQLTDDGGAGEVLLERRSNRIIRFAGGKAWLIDIDAVAAAGTQPARRPVDSYRRLVAELPPSVEVGDLPALDADGERVFFPGRQLDHPSQPQGINELNLSTGTVRRVAEVPFRPGHLQCSPLVPGLIMMCNASETNTPARIWLLNANDSKSLRPLFREYENDWVTHEVWCGPDRVLFILWQHRNIGTRPFGITSIRDGDRHAVLMAGARYWHVVSTPDPFFAVADTMEGSLYLVDLARGQDKLLTQGHMSDPTKPHPHPSVSPDGRRVLFVSNHYGNADLMTIELPPWDKVPPLGRQGNQRPTGIVPQKESVPQP
jgi:oligogalacturonide lyase